jgi:hypothetical protein
MDFSRNLRIFPPERLKYRITTATITSLRSVSEEPPSASLKQSEVREAQRELQGRYGTCKYYLLRG